MVFEWLRRGGLEAPKERGGVTRLEKTTIVIQEKARMDVGDNAVYGR